MESPIYYKEWHWPVREKALDEENSDFARWIEFGKHPDGSIDIHWSTGGMDILIGVPADLAAQILEARDKFCSKVVKILNSREHTPQT